jgi:hypothetical protein
MASTAASRAARGGAGVGEGDPQGGVVEALGSEPGLVLEGPVVAAAPHPAWRSRNLPMRWRARFRSITMSARARHRSRTASSATVGPRTEESWPARNSMARRLASRRSVLTRSPGAVGISEGAATSQCIPALRGTRASS